MKIIILSFVIGIALQLKLKNKEKNHSLDNSTIPNTKPIKEIWKSIFDSITNPLCEISKYKKTYDASQDFVRFGNTTYLTLPKKRENFYSELAIGFGKSAFLFDYLDELLQKPMYEAFKQIEAEIKKQPMEDPNYKDVYSPLRMLNLEDKPNSKDIDNIDLLNKINNILPDGFDMSYWSASYNTVQINLMIEKYNWSYNPYNRNPARALVENFDFNGDGRLSINELIIAIIDSNKSIYGENKCKFCLEDIVSKFIDPIFDYFTCKLNNLASTEEIWENLRFLNRNGSTLYDMYKCKVGNSYLRTNTVNDFVLKASYIKSGFLTREEFRLGILVGYWDRQTSYGSIVEGNSKNKKTSRWFDPNGIDRECGI